MTEIKTKFGSFYYYKKGRNQYVVCDSNQWNMFLDLTRKELNEFIALVKESEDLDDWLCNYDDVCWGTEERIFEFARDYAEMNGRKFDREWVDEHYNVVGNTFVLFGYSEAYKTRSRYDIH